MKMKRYWIARSLMYMVFVVGIAFSAFYLGAPRPAGALTCCNVARDCNPNEGGDLGADLNCCVPSGGQANCDTGFVNYCKSGSCS